VSAENDTPTVSFPSATAWDHWLSEQHELSTGVWLEIGKKQSGLDSVSYAEALDVALRYGWIDGQKRKLDEGRWLQKFTPRRPGSRWSKINREKATRLIETGVMKPAGLREVERARADGRWDSAYDPQSTATIPKDLEQQLANFPEARAFFEGLDSANRYAITYRINDAKNAETRRARIDKYVIMLREGRTLHPRRS
jgi:uncharacterized protein YdeI (YjbR/CyaY-like superfamily)